MSHGFYAWVYMLRCKDGSFYVGSHRGEEVEERISQHMEGCGSDYTKRRLPVELVWAEGFTLIIDAIAAERRIKGWSRAKKIALIDRDYDRIRELAKRRGGKAHS